MTTTNPYISTPGEILLEEFLKPLGISQYRLAKAIQRPQSAVSDIIHGRRAITPEMAWLLGKALGTTPEFWLNLEATYRLKLIDESSMPEVALLARPHVPPRARPRALGARWSSAAPVLRSAGFGKAGSGTCP